MSRLANEISKLTNPLPQFEDPEDLNDRMLQYCLNSTHIVIDILLLPIIDRNYASLYTHMCFFTHIH